MQSAAEATEHRWFKNLPIPKNLTNKELTELKIRHQQTEAKTKQVESAKQAADAIERACRMAMNIGRRRIGGLNPSLAATPGVIVYPPRPLLASTFPAIQTKLNLTLQQQMIVVRTQQIQRHIALAHKIV